MYIIYSINLLLYIYLECYYPLYLSKNLGIGLISPITIAAYTFLPILMFKVFIGPFFALEDGIMNIYFNFAILMTNIALICKFYLTKYTLIYLKIKNTGVRLIKTCMPHWRTKRTKIYIAAFILLFLGLAFFYLLASHSFGLLNWLKDSRTGYQLHRSGAGQYFAFAILFYSVSYTIFCLYLKKNSNVIKCIILYIILIYFLGSKEVILNFGISGLIFLWFRKYKYLKKAIVYGVPCVLSIMLLNFGSISFADIASYFDYYVNSSMYYEEYFANKIDLFYGKIYWSSFWEVVPRSFYPDKPYVYGILYVNEHFFPGMAEATNTPAFGGPIASFADWGILGVIISSFFNFSLVFDLFIYFYLFRKSDLNEIRKNPALLYCVILLFSPAFMRFIGFPINFILWLFIVKIISISNRLKITKNHANIR